MGHMVHKTRFSQSYDNAGTLKITPQEETFIQKNLSTYPKNEANGRNDIYVREVFAELWARIIDGEQLTDDLQNIFEKIKNHK